MRGSRGFAPFYGHAGGRAPGWGWGFTPFYGPGGFGPGWGSGGGEGLIRRFLKKRDQVPLPVRRGDVLSGLDLRSLSAYLACPAEMGSPRPCLHQPDADDLITCRRCKHRWLLEAIPLADLMVENGMVVGAPADWDRQFGDPDPKEAPFACCRCGGPLFYGEDCWELDMDQFLCEPCMENRRRIV